MDSGVVVVEFIVKFAFSASRFLICSDKVVPGNGESSVNLTRTFTPICLLNTVPIHPLNLPPVIKTRLPSVI